MPQAQVAKLRLAGSHAKRLPAAGAKATGGDESERNSFIKILSGFAPAGGGGELVGRAGGLCHAHYTPPHPTPLWMEARRSPRGSGRATTDDDEGPRRFLCVKSAGLTAGLRCSGPQPPVLEGVLQPGESVLALETALEPSSGQERVRTDRGWASLENRLGDQLLVPVHSSPSSRASDRGSPAPGSSRTPLSQLSSPMTLGRADSSSMRGGAEPARSSPLLQRVPSAAPRAHRRYEAVGSSPIARPRAGRSHVRVERTESPRARERARAAPAAAPAAAWAAHPSDALLHVPPDGGGWLEHRFAAAVATTAQTSDSETEEEDGSDSEAAELGRPETTVGGQIPATVDFEAEANRRFVGSDAFHAMAAPRGASLEPEPEPEPDPQPQPEPQALSSSTTGSSAALELEQLLRNHFSPTGPGPTPEAILSSLAAAGVADVASLGVALQRRPEELRQAGLKLGSVRKLEAALSRRRTGR